jgi:hypothetical protein
MNQTMYERYEEYLKWLNEPTEISDEEIEKAFIFYYGKNTVVKYRIWTLAIDWYKEQLKQKK